MTRQYIGARYVPKFYSDESGSAEWRDSVPYEALTIVTHLGNSYTSKKPVPIGVQINDINYWVLSGDYNVQVEQLRQLVERKTSDDYIGDIVADKMLTSAVNRWNVDVDADVAPNFTPSTIPFELINRGAFNFNNKFVIKRFDSAPTAEMQNMICPIDGLTSFDVSMKQNGLSCKNNSNLTAELQTRFVETPIASGSYIGFTVDCSTSDDTHYARIGIRQDKYLIYFNNVTKTIYYETDSKLFVPTELNAKRFESGSLDIIIGYSENRTMNVFARQGTNSFEYMGSVTTNEDNKKPNTRIWIREGDVERHYSIYNIEYFYSGISFSDCRYIHYDDTTPFISNNKAYLMANLQDGYGSACTAIISHTLGSNDFEIIGVIYSNNDPSALGTDICFDRKNKKFICLFRQDTNDGTRFYYAESYMSTLSGVHYFDSVSLPSTSNPTEFGTMKNDEDPTICLFNGHWYVAINRAANSTSSTFYYEIFISETDEFDISKFTHYCTLNGDLTGGSFIVLGNKLYFVCGNGTLMTSFNVTDKTIDGNMQLNLPTERVWGNITSVVRGNKLEFYITTFDRTRMGDGNWTYGGYFMYKATTRYDQKCRPITFGER